MWGRILQMLCAGWLAVSPFLLSAGEEPALAFISNFVCASVIFLLAAGSFYRRAPHLHVATALPALWIIAVAFLAEPSPPPPLHQNGVILGMVLLILIFVPSHAAKPPRGWHEFNARYRIE